MAFAKPEPKSSLGHSVSDPQLLELCTMHTYKRPAWSKGEEAFIKRYIEPTGATPDDFGNYWLTLGTASPIMWSCHTDTVHKTSGTQRVMLGDGCLTTDSGECLGADDTAGCWIMLQMIRAGVPGTYIFHRAEEIGGLGSEWIAENHRDRLAGLKFAIAFDRKGCEDIITDQYGNTASDEFAMSLAEALRPMNFAPSSKGIFTDTQNYAGIIPECSNIAVGYFNAHQPTEFLLVNHVMALAKRMIAGDFSALVERRDPLDWHWDDHKDPWANFPKGSEDAPRDLVDFVYHNSDDVAAFLHECGYDVWDLKKFMEDRGRKIQ